jgi:glucose-1-phosphate adenylyltransferase
MKDVMGIINSASEKKFLKEITQERSMASVPYGGRYRIIDFALSNMINSGITNVGMLVQSQYRSLMDHVRSGKEWDLARKTDGLFILPPFFENPQINIVKGDLELFSGNMEYLQHTDHSIVVISNVNYICNIDFKKVVKFHREKRADISVIYNQDPCGDVDSSNCITVNTDDDDRIIDMKANQKNPEYNKKSIETYVINKDILISLINECIARNRYDFTKDLIMESIRDLKVYGYEFGGYVADIHSVKSYYKHNMDLLDSNICEELFFDGGTIHTKVKDMAPTKYSKGSDVSNSLVANGCIIEGQVKNSIIFRDVKIEKGAVVKNSIVMEGCVISKDSSIYGCILDKEVSISESTTLQGTKEYPVVIEKRSVV